MNTIKTVEVRGREIGGDRLLVCVPIAARTREDLGQAADEILALRPDIVEWRADYLDEVEDIPAVLGHLKALRDKLRDFPIIFTCRIDREGGARLIPQEKRFELMRRVIATGQVDILDIELCNGEDSIRDILEAAKGKGVRVILSHHDFAATPPEAMILERLMKAQAMGADMAKIAVMPNSMGDVLTLLSATNAMRERHATIPLITVSMSGLGLVSRIGAGIFGSSITFAAGKAATAPGQITFAELHRVLDILQENM